MNNTTATNATVGVRHFLPDAPSHENNGLVQPRISTEKSDFPFKHLEQFNIKITPAQHRLLQKSLEYPPLDVSRVEVKGEFSAYDLSGKSYTEVFEFLSSKENEKWINEYLMHIKNGQAMPMPAMQETTKRVLNIFSVLQQQYKIGDDFIVCINRLWQAFDTNAKRGYPSLPSEWLVRCFCELRFAIVAKYGEHGDEQVPITPRGSSLIDPYVIYNKLSKLEDAKSELSCSIYKKSFDVMVAIDPTAILDSKWNDGCYSSPCQWCCLHPLDFSDDYKMSFDYESIRFLVIDKITLSTFNKLFAKPIMLLGVMDKHTVEYHDGIRFDCASLLEHDSHHWNQRSISLIFIDCPDAFFKALGGGIDFIYNELKKSLDADLFLLLEYLIFLTTHEYLYADGENLNLCLIDLKDVPPLAILSFFFDVDPKIHYENVTEAELFKLCKGRFLSSPITEQDEKLQALLNDKKIGRQLAKIYSIVDQEITAACKDKRQFLKENVLTDLSLVQDTDLNATQQK